MRSAKVSHKDHERLKSAGGARFSGKHFSLRLLSLPDGAVMKCTCVVSTKVSKKAVERNRIKRHCREIARNILRGRGRSVIYVLYAKPSAIAATRGELVEDVRKLFIDAEGRTRAT